MACLNSCIQINCEGHTGYNLALTTMCNVFKFRYSASLQERLFEHGLCSILHPLFSNLFAFLSYFSLKQICDDV